MKLCPVYIIRYLSKRAIITIVLLLLCPLGTIFSQDILSAALSPDKGTQSGRSSLPRNRHLLDTVSVPPVRIPSPFLNLKSNELSDETGALYPVWDKLRLLSTSSQHDTVRIVHIGDSHIRGHIFPQAVGTCLQERFKALSYIDMGVNGASCSTFTNAEMIARIAQLKPDLLILSFGTNESHNRHYNPMEHYRQMDELVRMIREALPGIPLLMTTPPGSYVGVKQRHRRYYYTVNPRTLITVRTIKQFSKDNGLALWDMYEILGGNRRACENWLNAGLMRPDHVHFLLEGYLLQGNYLAQALIKAYNTYVQH